MADPPTTSGSTVAPPVLDHLALNELRAYRDELAAEETRIAYCRRVLRIQLEMTQEGRRAATTNAAFAAALARGSRVDRLGPGPAAILDMVPAAGLPALPELAALCQDETTSDALLAADRQFAAYQEAVRARFKAATAELIARYKERPTLAARVLPLRPPVQPRTTRY